MKLSAIDRILLTIDENSFREIDSGISNSVITGIGKVYGREVCIYAQNSQIHGGTLGKAHAQRIINVINLANKKGCPLIGIHDSGGARIQEGVDALNGYGEIFGLLAQLKGKFMTIAAILGPCAGGAAYSPALMDMVFVVKGLSKMFINGPTVIKSVTGEDIDSEELGGANVLTSISGNAHFIFDNEEDCLNGIRDFICLASNVENSNFGKSETKNNRDTDNPYSLHNGYDVRNIIKALADNGLVMEISENFAKNCVTALSKVGGRCVGFVANQHSIFNGAIDIDASDKIASFIEFCNNFGFPIITLVDTEGFKTSRYQEHGGLIRHASRIIYEYSRAKVLKISVILRNAFGGGYVAMGSKSLGADVVFAWDNAAIAVMQAEAAVRVIYKKNMESLTATDYRKLIKNYEQEFMNCRQALRSNLVDEIVAPEDTRSRIVAVIKSKAVNINNL